MKFEAHYYSETGNMESTEYSDNLYSLLRNYSVFWQNDKYKPTLWITEGNVSLRIHDFAFKELTPETYCAYLQERILEADRLLSEIDFASPDELYTNRPDKLEKAVYSLLAKAEIDHTGKLDTKSPSYKKAMRITRSNFPDLFCDLDEDVDLIFKIILSSILTQTLMLADKLFSALFQMTRHNAWLEIKITLTF